MIGTGNHLHATIPGPGGLAHAIRISDCTLGDEDRASSGLASKRNATTIGVICSPAPERLTIGIKALLVDAIAGTILGIRLPSDEPATIAQGRDARDLLSVGRGGVDEDFPAGLSASVGVALLVDAVAGTILTRGLPRDEPAAVAQRRDARGCLIVARGGVDEDFPAGFDTGTGIALLVDAVAGTILGIRLPSHEPAAVAQRRDARDLLSVGRGGVDEDFAAGFGAGVGVALLVDAIAGTILGIRLPSDEPATIAQGRDALRLLGVECGGVDEDFATGFGTGAGVALLVDAVGVVILLILVIGLPSDKPAAVA